MRWRFVGTYLALDRLRYPFALICLARRRHSFRFSPNEDFTGYCTLCHRWPVPLPPRTPEQIAEAKRWAKGVSEALDWGKEQ
jgi:hypothetical protein